MNSLIKVIATGNRFITVLWIISMLLALTLAIILIFTTIPIRWGEVIISIAFVIIMSILEMDSMGINHRESGEEKRDNG